jgi:hypothetical protein
MVRAPVIALPALAPLADYSAQSAALHAAWREGAPWAIDLFHRRHPRFLDEQVPWLPKNLSRDQVRQAPLDEHDARLALARWYDFADWAALEAHVQDVHAAEPSTRRFEQAVECVVDGDVATLRALLAADQGLVHRRSTRVTHFDPPVHGAMLLHYVAANGVENYRQRTPPNAVDVARTVLEAGAVPDAVAHLYGGECTTMSLLVSSDHPRRAGVQAELVDVLVDFGASVEAVGTGSWTSPLLTALTFNMTDAAEALVRRGARIDSVAAAAGMGRLDDLNRLLPAADAEGRHRALALAAQLGRAEAVRRLLDAGEDPDRYNPKAAHAHATPLHHAALGGHLDAVQALVERGARLDMRDTIHKATPLGWALYADRAEVADYLRDHGAPE